MALAFHRLLEERLLEYERDQRLRFPLFSVWQNSRMLGNPRVKSPRTAYLRRLKDGNEGARLVLLVAVLIRRLSECATESTESISKRGKMLEREPERDNWNARGV
ncbi:MAG TPA: hypothetical protein VNY04_11045 [Chthoniobacterales bacterium]|nr:hypothetical protein [Chthoniobacterales bacterium]